MAGQTHGKYGIMNRACRYGANSRGACVGSGLGRQTVNGVVCGSTGSFEIHSEILSVRPRPFPSVSFPVHRFAYHRNSHTDRIIQQDDGPFGPKHVAYEEDIVSQ
jgi:hypothetical protein